MVIGFWFRLKERQSTESVSHGARAQVKSYEAKYKENIFIKNLKQNIKKMLVRLKGWGNKTTLPAVLD